MSDYAKIVVTPDTIKKWKKLTKGILISFKGAIYMRLSQLGNCYQEYHHCHLIPKEHFCPEHEKAHEKLSDLMSCLYGKPCRLQTFSANPSDRWVKRVDYRPVRDQIERLKAEHEKLIKSIIITKEKGQAIRILESMLRLLVAGPLTVPAETLQQMFENIYETPFISQHFVPNLKNVPLRKVLESINIESFIPVMSREYEIRVVGALDDSFHLESKAERKRLKKIEISDDEMNGASDAYSEEDLAMQIIPIEDDDLTEEDSEEEGEIKNDSAPSSSLVAEPMEDAPFSLPDDIPQPSIEWAQPESSRRIFDPSALVDFGDNNRISNQTPLIKPLFIDPNCPTVDFTTQFGPFLPRILLLFFNDEFLMRNQPIVPPFNYMDFIVPSRIGVSNSVGSSWLEYHNNFRATPEDLNVLYYMK